MMSKGLNDVVSNIGKRLFTDKSINTMKENMEKVLLDDNKHDTDVCKVFEDNSVITDELFVVDELHIDNNNVFNDVEFFTTMYSSNSHQSTVFDNIHNCASEGGKLCSKHIYQKPICDADLLKKRAMSLLWIEKQYLLNKDRVNVLLEILKKTEKNVVWLLEEKEENIKDLYSMVFFRLKGLSPLNNVGSAITTYNLYRVIVSPLFGIISPIFYFVIPYLIVLYKFKVYVPFGTYIKTVFYAMFNSTDTLFGNNKFFKYLRIMSYMFSAVFYFQGIFTSIDVAKTVSKMSKLIVSSFNSVIEYMEASQELQNIFWNQEHMSSYVDIQKACPHTKEEQDEYIASLTKSKKEFTLFGNFGEQLKIYKQNNVNVMRNIVTKTCVLDALLGAVRLKCERNYSFASFDKGEGTPYIQMIGMVHPCISIDKAVMNDINLGVNGYKKNAIITSPNSSGKSVLIKSIIINVLMAQTMGMSCCKDATITPFRFINTQINVPDSTGLESLFEAEMHRCKFTLDKLKELQESSGNGKLYTLTIMDEIFNSTNPIEAVAGAYAVCKKLTSFKTNMLLFTTHFGYLTKLAKEPECNFANYKMETIVDDKTDRIEFTYKLQQGINKHMLALELLKKSGFSIDILDDAIAIKKKLVTRTTGQQDKQKIYKNL